jgi:enoyl-CoA hydratase
MGSLVSYDLHDSVATIRMDDGKVNVLSPAMQHGLNEALDRAQDDGAAVLLTGREGVFSAGFDLGLLRAGGSEAVNMIHGGFRLADRLLSFPLPVVVAATGHAIAMGLFILLGGDYRIGTDGPFTLAANEVAIGLPIPLSAIEILRYRLNPAAADRAALLAHRFTPDSAAHAGILDRVVPADELAASAREAAVEVSTLDRKAFSLSKVRTRLDVLDRLRRAIDADDPTLLTPA